jgi:hypothetical protein
MAKTRQIALIFRKKLRFLKLTPPPPPPSMLHLGLIAGRTILFRTLCVMVGCAAHAGEWSTLRISANTEAAEVPVACCFLAGRPCVAISGIIQTEIDDV